MCKSYFKDPIKNGELLGKPLSSYGMTSVLPVVDCSESIEKEMVSDSDELSKFIEEVFRECGELSKETLIPYDMPPVLSVEDGYESLEDEEDESKCSLSEESIKLIDEVFREYEDKLDSFSYEVSEVSEKEEDELIREEEYLSPFDYNEMQYPWEMEKSCYEYDISEEEE